MPARDRVVGEPRSALNQMANDEHRQVKVGLGDLVIISGGTIPGNEEVVGAMLNKLFERGANVIYGRMETVHVSGHGSRDELRMMIETVRPTFMIPAHGEARHLYLHAQIAAAAGISPENVYVLRNGAQWATDGQRAWIEEQLPVADVLVDGRLIGEIGEIAARPAPPVAGRFIVARSLSTITTGWWASHNRQPRLRLSQGSGRPARGQSRRDQKQHKRGRTACRRRWKISSTAKHSRVRLCCRSSSAYNARGSGSLSMNGNAMSSMTQRLTGTIKWYNARQGFGFVTPDTGGDDVFVHHSALAQSLKARIDIGARVVFNIEHRKKGPTATDVTRLDEVPPQPDSPDEGARFDELDLAPDLLRAVGDAGYTVPTSIQVQAIPHVLAGRDVMGCAQTGTGKTAAFALPILQRLAASSNGHRPNGQRRGRPARPTRALILPPTRDWRSRSGTASASTGATPG